MALGTPTLVTSNFAKSVTSGTTAAFSGASGTVLLVHIGIYRTTGTSISDPTLTQTGATWTKLASTTANAGGVPRYYDGWFYTTDVPSSATLTIDFTTTGTCVYIAWTVISQSGAATTQNGTTGVDHTDSGVAITPTLSGFTNGNSLPVAGIMVAASRVVATTGWTEITPTLKPEFNMTLGTWYNTSQDASADFTWTTAVQAAGSAVEILAPSAGGGAAIAAIDAPRRLQLMEG